MIPQSTIQALELYGLEDLPIEAAARRLSFNSCDFELLSRFKWTLCVASKQRFIHEQRLESLFVRALMGGLIFYPHLVVAGLMTLDEPLLMLTPRALFDTLESLRRRVRLINRLRFDVRRSNLKLLNTVAVHEVSEQMSEGLVTPKLPTPLGMSEGLQPPQPLIMPVQIEPSLDLDLFNPLKEHKS